MKKSILHAFLMALSLNFMYLPSVLAQADSGMVYLKPIMIIRFNQPQVEFQAPLKSMIREALNAKHNIHFDIIQYIPTQSNDIAKQKFAANREAITKTFEENGINNAQYSTSQQPSDQVASDEIYIFIR